MSLKGLLKSGYSQIQEMDFDRPIEQYVERLGHYVINHGLPDLDVTFGDGVENLILTGIAKIDAAAGALVDFVTAHPGAAVDFVTGHRGAAADFVAAHPGAAVDFVTAHRGAAVDFVAAHPGAAADFVAAHPGAAVDFVTAHRGAAVDFVAAHPGAAVDFVTAHPGAAADFVTAHPGPAADIVSDILDGGLGTAALVVKSQLDAVTDANSTFDFGSIHIRLEDGVLAALAARDIHPSSDLLLRAAANDRIVYDGATGGLLFDRDGSGPGAGIQFATVSHGIALATPQG